MSWEQQISELLQQLETCAVRFDIPQGLNETQQQTARQNIDIKSTASNISGDDYEIILSY